MREVVGLVEEAALLDFELSHAPISGINTADAVIRAARSVCDDAVLESFGRDPLQQWNFGADVVEVVHREANQRSGFGAPGLQFGASRENEDQVSSEGAECRPQSALKTCAISQKQHDSRNAPR